MIELQPLSEETVPMNKRVALYLRVSTGDGQQTIENQRRALDEIAERAGWEVAEVYSDEISGTKGRERRPAFDRMLRAAVHRKFDMIAAWSVDRLGRSLQDLVAFLGELKAAGVDLFLHQQALDTSTPSGRALFQMLGVFAEFEAAMIRERTRAGLARARAQGKRLGRPPITRMVSAAVLRSLAAGVSVRKTAQLHRVGISTVQRIKATGIEDKLQ
jgi:DNA invertase Pin-like site-specific DNA recombinase